MKVFYEIHPGLLEKSAIALGFFDGVHLGHQAVIDAAIADAREMAISSALVTFKEHPRTLTTGKSPLLLTVLAQRLALAEQLGIAATVVLEFTEQICRLTPREYVTNILVECLGARSVSVGYNHRFGRNREGDPQLLRQLGGELGFTVHVAPPVLVDQGDVSSSRIREALANADVELARKLLGRPYAVLGEVMRGQGRGRTLGFPTVNLKVSEIQLLPARGVYAGVTQLADGRRLASVINLGVRPTVSSEGLLTVEAHILDFQGDLYDQTLSVEFWRFLRAEAKFESMEALRNQIAADCQAALGFLPGRRAEAGRSQDNLRRPEPDDARAAHLPA
jgi:riboflavin kinase/FMN adenylyltransferase